MQQDLFASKTEPSFLREHHGDLSRIPNRAKSLAAKPPTKAVEGKQALTHFVFAKLVDRSKLPPQPKRKVEPWPGPERFCFMNRGLAYLKFDDKKQIDKWFEKTGGSSKPYKIWTCIFCKKLHYIPFPVDDSTSGKTPRIWEFLIKMGHSPEEVYGLATTTK